MTSLNRESFYKLVSECISGNSRELGSAKRFLARKPGDMRYAIGLNDETLALHNSIGIDGIIYDGSLNDADNWNDIPLVKSRDVPKEAMVANCSTSISPVDTGTHLKKIGIPTIANIGDIIFLSEAKIPWPWFVNEQRNSLKSNADDWWLLYSNFNDDESRKQLIDIVKFRLTANPDSMLDYKTRLLDQYFEDFLEINHEIFVDAGGFDGDTTEEFCKRYPDYREVLFFEPSIINMTAAKSRLENLKNIEFYQFGLSDGPGRLQFDSDSGSASSISSSGSEYIDVEALDNVRKKPVTFIKMDLEGWELPALQGCRQTIIDHKPKLAISVYHSAKDFIDIPRYVRSLRPDYRISLRHYTQGWSETVMFFY